VFVWQAHEEFHNLRVSDGYEFDVESVELLHLDGVVARNIPEFLKDEPFF